MSRISEISTIKPVRGHLPVPASLRVDEQCLDHLRVENNDIVHFSHSIIASMYSKHITNSAPEIKILCTMCVPSVYCVNTFTH